MLKITLNWSDKFKENKVQIHGKITLNWSEREFKKNTWQQ
jgi:hypothetical protein